MTASPLTPADCDLQDSKFMPMFVQQMLNSSFNAMADDTAWRAGVTLWMRAWHQVPAASLPDDDEQLCQMAGFGREMKAWQKVKPKALRGWSVADDGRLYHPLIAAAALENWISRLLARISSGAGNTKRYGIEFDADAVEAQIESSYHLLKAIDPDADGIKKLDKRKALRDNGGKPVKKPGRKPGESATETPTGRQAGQPPELPPASQGKAEAEGKAPTGESISYETLSPSGSGAREGAKSKPVPEFKFSAFFNEYPNKAGIVDAESDWDDAIAEGAEPAEIVAGMRRWVAKWKSDGTLTRDDGRWVPNPAKWLQGRRWLDPTDGGLTTPARTWPGPQAIRDALMYEFGKVDGELFAKSYLDPADWEAPSTIVAATQYAADKLRAVKNFKSYKIRKRSEEAA